MSIPISPEVGVLLLVLFIGYMLYAGVVLAEVGMIVGSRFVVPPVLGEVIGRDSGLYDLVDIGVFLAILFCVLALGRRLKARIA
jgi:hypothetical protein